MTPPLTPEQEHAAESLLSLDELLTLDVAEIRARLILQALDAEGFRCEGCGTWYDNPGTICDCRLKPEDGR